MFKRIFGEGRGDGGGAGVSKSAQEQTLAALNNLEQQENQMEKRKEVLSTKIDLEDQKVKALLKDNKKSQAMMTLKRKKLLEKQLEGLDTNLARIMEQRSQLESNQSTIASIAALRLATAAQKATLSEMKIESVENTLEEIQDANDQMNEINNALATPIGPGMDMDEDDLEKELEMMNAEMLDGDLLDAGTVPHTQVATEEQLPAAPTKVAAKKKQTPEELELEALQKEMGLLEPA